MIKLTYANVTKMSECGDIVILFLQSTRKLKKIKRL